MILSEVLAAARRQLGFTRTSFREWLERYSGAHPDTFLPPEINPYQSPVPVDDHPRVVPPESFASRLRAAVIGAVAYLGFAIAMNTLARWYHWKETGIWPPPIQW